MVVTAMAAYQWLKAALFVQLFGNMWSALSHSSTSLRSGVGQNYAILLLLAVALYLFVLGWGLWNLQKWALLLILLIWLVDLAYDFTPEFFGLEHVPGFWLGDQSLFLFLGITILDIIAFFSFANRETFKAFKAEEEGKIFRWLETMFWWTR